MIDGLSSLLWLALGLASIEGVGYSLLVVLLPLHSGFTSLERFSLGFGLGLLALTMWMLTLSFWGIAFGLGWILGPWIVGLGPGLLLNSRRLLWQHDLRWLKTMGWKLLTLGYGTGWTAIERALLALLILTFGFALLRATLYPMWAWDAVTIWGLKAKAFYLGGRIDLAGFEAHNYYPNLVPLGMAYLYLWLGGVIDHLVKALFPLWGGCLVLIFYSLLRRLEVERREALLGSAFLMLNGLTLITHLFIAYADLALTYYTLITAGLLLLWLKEEAPKGSMLLVGIFSGGMLWSKYEGEPLALINFLAAVITLFWLRPPAPGRKLASVAGAGLISLLFFLPWRYFCLIEQMDIGVGHLCGFFPAQLGQGLVFLLKALVWPPYFGILWPVVFLALVWQGRDTLASPGLFLILVTLGNLAAVVLGYALVPASAAEFPWYMLATIDRLLLHVAPASGLLLAVPLTSRMGDIPILAPFNFFPRHCLGQTLKGR
ncbi:MAG: hypothetical protein ACLFUU_01005 [Desulfobacteraceae bacterium]